MLFLLRSQDFFYKLFVLCSVKGAYKTTSTLEIRDILIEDHGEYSCVAVNSLLPSETKVTKRALLKVRGNNDFFKQLLLWQYILV